MVEEKLLVSVVYAKCSRSARSRLWQELEELASSDDAWLVGGDFNIVREPNERLGGNTIDFRASNDCIRKCGFMEFATMGSKFTWQKSGGNMWQKLDRFLCNFKWKTLFADNVIHNLSRENSHHAPMLGRFNVDQIGSRAALNSNLCGLLTINFLK